MPSPRHISAAPDSPRNDLPRDRRFPGVLRLVGIPSHGERLHGIFYRAAGAGPHPTLALLHGFPGVEQNADLAHAARRAGWNVVVPHYRGSWSSPGRYSWTNVLEDAAAAVDWIRADSIAPMLGSDPTAVAVAGHSLGGFAALMTAASDPMIAGAASIAGFNFGAYTAALANTPDGIERTAAAWTDDAAVLHGTSGRALAVEAFERDSAWDLRRAAGGLAGTRGDRPLLLVAASDDDIAPPELHHEPLVGALRAAGARALTSEVFTTDHSFVDARLALANLLVDWLGTIRQSPSA